MLTVLLLYIVFPGAAGATGAPPAALVHAASQDPAPAPAPDERADVKEKLAELDRASGAKGKNDDAAIPLVDWMLQQWETLGPKDRKAVAKALGAVLRQKRLVDEAQGENPEQVYRMHRAAAVALSRMAPESVPVLLAAVDDKDLRKIHVLIRPLVLSLGKTRAADAIDPLLRLLDHKDYLVQGAAAEALLEFHEAELETRKQIFEELLKIITTLKTKVDEDPSDADSKERYDIISGATIGTLQALSGESIRDPAEWQRWWNKNKKADWTKKG
jgi:hypothetical protein